MSTQATRLGPVPGPRGEMTIEQARQVLEVAPAASVDELHEAWRTAAKRVHPDAGGTAEKFGEVTAAYELLREVAKAPAGEQERRPALSIVWWLASSATATAVAVLVLLLLRAGDTIAAGPLAVYTLGMSGYGWWRAAGRPTPQLRRPRQRRRLIPRRQPKG